MITGSAKTRNRAALLLEVVVALTIMVSAMGILGAQLVHGLRMTGEMEKLTRAAELGDRILALIDLDPTVQQQIESQIQSEEEIHGDFGDAYLGWFWRAQLVPIDDTPGLTEVHIQILYADAPEDQESIDRANVVYQVSLLKATPGRIDLVQDFGLDDDQAAELATMIPLPDFDPNNIDPQALVAYMTENPEALLELLPSLLPLFQQFAGAGYVPGGQQLGADQLGGLADQLGGGNGDIDPAQLEELLRLGAQLGGQQAGPRAGGASRGRGGEGLVGVTRPNGAGGQRGQRGQGGQAGGQNGAQPGMTIEDLIRLRDELRQQGGGR